MKWVYTAAQPERHIKEDATPLCTMCAYPYIYILWPNISCSHCNCEGQENGT